MNRFDWFAPQTVAAAAAAATATTAEAMSGRATDTAILKAGGIDLLDLMKENLVAPQRLVNLRDVPGLDQIREDRDGGLHIGALVTLAALGRDARLRPRYAALADAIESAGSPQLRSLSTLGGNILQRPRCWYFRSADFPCRRKGGAHCFALSGENQYHGIFDNDLCAIVHPSTAAMALVALGAEVELVDPQGKERRLALEDFFVGPSIDVTRENDLRAGEVLTAICLPAKPAHARSLYLKQTEKAGFDWPLAEVAVALELGPNGICRNAAIVLGAAAPVPYRARAAESLLAGRPVESGAAADAAHAALMGATPLAGNNYKLPIFAALVRRAILGAAARA